MNARVWRAAAAALAVAAARCSGNGGTPPASDPQLDLKQPALSAMLWAATSAERRALSYQAFATARQQLDRALADTAWRADLPRDGQDTARDIRALPPAIVIDVDDTVLDTAPYHADQLRPEPRRRFAGWREWIERAEATAVPGAIDFLRYARERQVRVFFVSNRDALLESATRRNLQQAGVVLDDATGGDAPDAVLLIGERPSWLSRDKSPRRAWVAESHRVLLLIGDDLNDFVLVSEDLAQRDAALQLNAERFGQRWIVLPNPMYGSWERAAYAGGNNPAALEPLLGR